MDECCEFQSDIPERQRAWPDILVGLAIALMFGTSVIAILREAMRTAPENRVLGGR